ncbi:hypothetical protein GCM10025734_51460 [Kitasatospora paranensis]
MRVEIPVDLLADRQGDENAELILKLIGFFREARHEWVISPHDMDVVRAFLERHVPVLAQIYLLLAQKASMAQAWAPHGGPPAWSLWLARRWQQTSATWSGRLSWLWRTRSTTGR